MQFSELTAVGTVMGAPSMEQTDGKSACKFSLKVEAPGKQGPRASEISCMVLGANAAHCWVNIKQGDEIVVVGVPFAEGFLGEDGKPRGRQCMRCNFVRYSQDTLNRIAEYSAS